MREWTASIVLAVVVAVTAAAVAASVDSGVKEAIQELYAEIRSLDTSVSGAVHLDDVTWNKAIFVLDKLRQMVGRDPTATAAAADASKDDRAFAAKATATAAVDDDGVWWEPQRHGKETPDAMDDGGTERPVEGVQKIMDRYANDHYHRVPFTVASPPQCPTDVYVDELERKFHAVFRQYDTREKTTAFHSTTVGSRPVRGNECKAKEPAQQSARPNGRFSGFKMFNKKRNPSIAQ